MRAPGEARAFIRKHLAALGFTALEDDVVLIATELVTNSVNMRVRTGRSGYPYAWWPGGR
jgi:hypothetical protein